MEPQFQPKNDITLAILVWVRLFHLPLHYWNEIVMRSIGNSLGKHIDQVKPKDSLFSCAHICVKLGMEKGLHESIQLTIGS